MWILAVVLCIIIAMCIGIIIYQESRIKNIKKNKDAQHLESYTIRIQALTDERDYLKNQLEAALQNNQNAEEALSSRYTALTDSLAPAEIKIDQLNTQVEERANELNTVAAAFKELDDQANEARAQNVAAASELNGYKLELQQIIKELDDAKETSRAALLKDYKNEENWFDFDLSNKEIKLVETIKEISGIYPELTKDLATIEWKKLWLPKFQDLANTNGLAVRGIYRLVLKDDENISYVGQAVNIKERWYEHAKKMIGADTKGTEKLYRYRPEDFYWTVLETGTNDLNTSEHYWIQYYCCKEVGLNKKA